MPCRSLTDEELKKIKEEFENNTDENQYNNRNYTIMFFQCYTGFRIAECLSLKIRDVYKPPNILSNVLVSAKNMKGGKASRSVPINSNCKALLEKYFKTYNLAERYKINREFPLFYSNKTNSFLETRSVNLIYKKMFTKCEIVDADSLRILATHSMRKTFAKKIYDFSGKDIGILQKSLNHKSISSTAHYIFVDSEKVKLGFESINLGD